MSQSARQWMPPPDLATTLDAAWWHRGGTAAAPVVILPDGCMDLIFHRKLGRAGWEAPRLFVTGPAERPETVCVGPGDHFVGLRFRPGMSRRVVEVDPAALRGRATPAPGIAPAFAALEDRLAETRSSGAALAVMLAEARRLTAGPRIPTMPARLAVAVDMLGRPRAGATVAKVAAAVGTTPRSLHRDVLAWTGLPPKTLARVLRLQGAVRRLAREPEATLATVAFAAGFADQAHMTRECRALAGTSPAALRRRGQPSDFDKTR